MNTQTGENPQAEVAIELKVFSEQEVTYQLSLFKQKMQRNKEVHLME